MDIKDYLEEKKSIIIDFINERFDSIMKMERRLPHIRALHNDIRKVLFDTMLNKGEEIRRGIDRLRGPHKEILKNARIAHSNRRNLLGDKLRADIKHYNIKPREITKHVSLHYSTLLNFYAARNVPSWQLLRELAEAIEKIIEERQNLNK